MPHSKDDEIIARVLTEVLGKPVAPGTRVTRADEERWDSLKHIEIVFAIEAAFGLYLSEEDIAAIQGTDDLKRLAGVPRAA